MAALRRGIASERDDDLLAGARTVEQHLDEHARLLAGDEHGQRPLEHGRVRELGRAVVAGEGVPAPTDLDDSIARVDPVREELRHLATHRRHYSKVTSSFVTPLPHERAILIR
jgi:hypothetical protein